ncbi:MAG: glycosyl transferase family 2 [Bacteroidetes bacterium HGW-Bacteroidetes-17]|nr:MAG: glycosyl transferase family 2 [Bacteroidetes bacterium HGW-Bacteroidetes-17]
MSDFLSKSFYLKFLKFGVVGFSGLLIDFGVTYLFKEVFKVQKYLANAIGFMMAASSNYFFNRIWTFKSTNPNIAFEYSEFIVISLIGLGINTLILWLLVSKYKLNFYLAKVFVIAVVTIWNFLANAFFTFS